MLNLNPAKFVDVGCGQDKPVHYTDRFVIAATWPFSLTEFLNIHRRYWYVLLSDIANTQHSTKFEMESLRQNNYLH
ncbi:hypothetical protein BpHYR1_000745 [Brachionus plicatilis]|uniref:Uncharacterized protein n=1 Tax=Brachionus plicatilis TaxID=10195 RepID=A0A3M7S3F4_BRAPC|nr:hypothetical protein BpHYR1_000745 [Brachionus plicatilis]